MGPNHQLPCGTGTLRIIEYAHTIKNHWFPDVNHNGLIYPSNRSPNVHSLRLALAGRQPPHPLLPRSDTTSRPRSRLACRQPRLHSKEQGPLTPSRPRRRTYASTRTSRSRHPPSPWPEVPHSSRYRLAWPGSKSAESRRRANNPCRSACGAAALRRSPAWPWMSTPDMISRWRKGGCRENAIRELVQVVMLSFWLDISPGLGWAC